MSAPAVDGNRRCDAVAKLEGEELAPVGLLHNMSSRPTAALHRNGVHRSRGLRVGVAEALGRVDIAVGDIEALCRHFGLGNGEPPIKALASLLHATARASSLPAFAALLCGAETPPLHAGMASIDDLALALAVASK